ncbi:MAG: class F sortase [Chloroflexi bacterium]|nr:class F sortase [Chloroflexota bacterium]
MSDAPSRASPRDRDAAAGKRRGSWLAYALAAAGAVAIFLGAFFATSSLTGDSQPPAGSAAPAPHAAVTGSAEAETPGDAAPAPPAPVQNAPAPILPEIDPADLTHGGDGSAGAILAGPGIVPSVGNRTPYEILIPRAKIRASVVGLGLAPNGAMGAPDNPDVVGWWADGVRPGQAGNLLLDGHVDYTDIHGQKGPGVAWLVREIAAGDVIVIQDAEARAAYIYRVTESLAVAVDDPTALRFLRPTEAATLTFVTCEGSFDRASLSYADRRVVRAALEATVPLGDASPPQAADL